jgi:pimeloyl-ACP methyl ester carboxylesterase
MLALAPLLAPLRIRGKPPVFLAVLAAGMLWPAPAGAADRIPRLGDLTGAARQRIDRAALALPPETPEEEKARLNEDVCNWLISQLTLPAEVELRHAREQHEKILGRFRSVQAPQAVQQTWSKLMGSLPRSFRPEGFSWTVTVLDMPQPTCFTRGGGYVYISRPLLDSLLSDKERGPTALAFVLAQNLGHIAMLHVRRGWLALELDQEQREQDVAPGLGTRQLQVLLETHLERNGVEVRFRYSRHQQDEADRFALHLCRNAQMDQDQALDGMRLLCTLEHPELLTNEKSQPPREGEQSRDRDPLLAPDPLPRLNTLLYERSGQVDDDKKYGLFLYDPDSDRLSRCKEKSIGANARPIIFVHGLHGSLESFRDFLRVFGEDRDLQGRPLLAFRYPNNESLARCSEYLGREMKRVVVGPQGAFFVCHSAGGLVVRYYTEISKGGFDRAVMLSTPHLGTHMAALKFLADVSAFAREMRGGLHGVVSRSVEEGHGAVLNDLQPDSLFLHYLGSSKELASRYHVFSGEPLHQRRIVGLEAALIASKLYLRDHALPRLHSPLLRRLAEQTIQDWRLPPEITRGDLVVTARSAQLKDAGHVTRTGLRHEQMLHDDDVMDRVISSILEK